MNESDQKVRQQRAFVRVKICLPCEVVCLMPDGALHGDGWTDAEIVEIGGGGARVKTALPVDADCVLSLRLVLPDDCTVLRVSARVVHVAGGGPIKDICLKFVGLSERDRALLIKHVFSEQIRKAKGELEDQARPQDEQADEDQSRD